MHFEDMSMEAKVKSLHFFPSGRVNYDNMHTSQGLFYTYHETVKKENTTTHSNSSSGRTVYVFLRNDNDI